MSRFEDLPLITVPSVHYPAHDGDLSLIDALIDTILERVPGRLIATTPSDTWIWDQTANRLGFDAHTVSAAISDALGRFSRG